MSLTVVLGLLMLLCPQEHFLGATRQGQHQHFLPCCVTMMWEQQLFGWSQINSGDHSQLWLFLPALPTVRLVGSQMGPGKGCFPEEGDARGENQSW